MQLRNWSAAPGSALKLTEKWPSHRWSQINKQSHPYNGARNTYARKTYGKHLIFYNFFGITSHPPSPVFFGQGAWSLTLIHFSSYCRSGTGLYTKRDRNKSSMLSISNSENLLRTFSQRDLLVLNLFQAAWNNGQHSCWIWSTRKASIIRRTKTSLKCFLPRPKLWSKW